MPEPLPFQPLTRQTAIVLRDLNATTPLIPYLIRRFDYLDASQWHEQIAAGHLQVNGRTAGTDTPLQRGDTLAFTPRQLEEPPVNWHIEIVARHEDILIVNKPPILPCHPAGRFFNHTLWAWLKQTATLPQPHFVNRLDRETSGLVLVAAHADAARRAAEALNHPDAIKEYLVVVHGIFPDYLDANGYIGRRADAKIRKKRYFMAEPQALLQPEPCRTRFRCLARGAGPSPLSLLTARLDSGRSHQIRATLASIGFPLLGDKLYGPDEQLFLKHIEQNLDDNDRALLQLDHQALHAWRLQLDLDPTSQPRLFCAPLPDDFSRLLRHHALTLPDASTPPGPPDPAADGRTVLSGKL